MRQRSILALALLVALACAAWLWFRSSTQAVPAESPAAAKVTREAGRGDRAGSPAGRAGQRAGGRMKGGIPESARLHRAEVKVELEPDMSAFGGNAPAPDPATEWDKLAGQDLLKALAGLAGPQENGYAKAWEIVKDEHDPAVKLAVMRAAAAKGGTTAAAILREGLAAEHPQIRYEAVELVEPMQGRDEGTRRELLGAAAASADPNVAAAALGQLANDPRKEDLELMFRFLDHPDHEIAESARGTIDFLIDAEFQSAAEAAAWWQGNGAKFDEELAPVE